MKKFILTYITGILLVGLLLYFRFYETKRPEKPAPTQIYNLNKEEIGVLELKKERQTILCQKVDGKWWIIHPGRFSADQDTVEDLVQRFALLEAERLLDQEPGDLGKYGLDKPSQKIRVKIKGETYTLLVGNKTPLGDGYYVKDSARNPVYTLSAYQVEKFNRSVDDLRDKAVFSFLIAEVNRFRLSYQGREIEAHRLSPKKWEISSPERVEGDKEKIERLLEKVKEVKVKKFVEDNPSDLKKYGLEEPEITLEIWMGENNDYRALLLGKEEEGILYAKRKAINSIYGLNPSLKEELDKKFSDLRLKRMLSFKKENIEEIELLYPEEKILCKKEEKGRWKIEKPVEKEADSMAIDNLLWAVNDLEAEKFVDDHPQDLSLYGLDKPQITLILKGKELSEEVFFGKVIKEKEGEFVQVKVKSKEPVFLVDKSIFEEVNKKLVDLIKKEEVKSNEQP